MEKEFFDWEQWDTVDEGVYQFLVCTVKKPMGEFSPGDQCPYIVVDYATGKLTICDDRMIERTYKLNLTIGEML